MFHQALLIISLCIPGLIRTSQLTPFVDNTHPATALLRAAHDWLVAQANDFTAAPHQGQKTTRPIDANLTEEIFTLSCPNNTPLVILRSNGYLCFSFTPESSPENLCGTPLAPFLSFLRNKFASNPKTTIKIPASNTHYFLCELDNSIHCVRKIS